MTVTNSIDNALIQAICDALNRTKTPIEVLAARHPDRVFKHVIDNEHLEHEVHEIERALIKGCYHHRMDVDALRRQAMSVSRHDLRSGH